MFRQPGGGSRKRRRQIDYNAEIPFAKQVPAGFYDASEDVQEVQAPNFKRMRQQDVAGANRDSAEQVRGLGTLLPLPLQSDS